MRERSERDFQHFIQHLKEFFLIPENVVQLTTDALIEANL